MRWLVLASLTVVAALTVGNAAAGPASAEAAYWHSCSPLRPVSMGSLRAHHVACGKARRVINDFYRKAQAEGPDLFVDGFHCVAIVGGTACRRGGQRIRLTGSSERLPVDEALTAEEHLLRHLVGGADCADFRFSARLDHRHWRFIVSDIHIPGSDVTCTGAAKEIKRLIRAHKVPGLRCEAGRPTWDANGHAYWSGYCLYPDGQKTTWKVEEYQLR